jgi:hypothetical protein
MNARVTLKKWVAGALVAIVVCSLTGCGSTLLSRQASLSGTTAVSDSVGAESGAAGAVPSAVPPTQESKAAYGGASSSDGNSTDVATPVQDRLVISNASMSIEVKNLDSGVAAVRALAAKYGATISELSVSAGTDTPVALDSGGGDASPVTPGDANITLRVPADKLAAAEKEAATLGRVLSQTASESDVTQQHVDMAARLKNLRAEEARLRAFLRRATKVSEMLSIEKQLSRVRGDIESMQAQLTFLERQAALATLTITLNEPGSLVSPAAGGWGFSAAVRDGVRAAAEVTRGLITFVLAVSPLLLLVLLAVLFIGMLVRRMRRRKLGAAAAAAHLADGATALETDATAPETDDTAS